MRMDICQPMGGGFPAEIMTRKQAADMGLTVYRSSNPCKKGHSPIRYVSNGNCLSCAVAKNAKQRYGDNVDADLVEKRRKIEEHQARKRDEYDF